MHADMEKKHAAMAERLLRVLYALVAIAAIIMLRFIVYWAYLFLNAGPLDGH